MTKGEPWLSVAIDLDKNGEDRDEIQCKGQMPIIDSDLIVFGEADNLDFEVLTWLQWKAALLFFGTPAPSLARIADGFTLIETWVEVECNISAIVSAIQQVEFESRCVVVGSTIDVQDTTYEWARVDQSYAFALDLTRKDVDGHWCVLHRTRYRVENSDRIRISSYHRETPWLTVLAAHACVHLNLCETHVTLDGHHISRLKLHAMIEISDMLIVDGDLSNERIASVGLDVRRGAVLTLKPCSDTMIIMVNG